ncbi:MAG: hypothetical protein PVI99_07845, partial [Anaerolineales bacterium]
MKPKDFFRIAGFILIFLAINKILVARFVPWSRAPYEYEVTRRGFEEVQEEIEVVILGDSHPQKSVMAEKIDDGYNFASSAESYIFTYYKLHYYLEKGSFQPSLAVVPIDMHSFSSFRLKRAESQDPAFWNQYVVYLEVGKETGSFWTFFRNRMLADFGLIGGLDSALAVFYPPEPLTATMMTSGYFKAEEDFSAASREEQFARTEERAAFHFSGYSYMEETLVEYFLRLLDLLESHGAQVVLVWYPVTEGYYEQAARYIPADSHLETVKELIAERAQLPIYDYHDLFWGHPEHFSDSDHL